MTAKGKQGIMFDIREYHCRIILTEGNHINSTAPEHVWLEKVGSEQRL